MYAWEKPFLEAVKGNKTFRLTYLQILSYCMYLYVILI